MKMFFDIIFLMLFMMLQQNLVMPSEVRIEDQRSSFIITSDDHKLVGQTIHKRKATDVFDCALCLIGDQCKSFNFNEATGDCYLNGRRAKDKELVREHGFIYGEKNHCEVKPCQNGGECFCQEDRQDYHCRCKTGFSGRNCQINEFGMSALTPAKTCLDLKKMRPSLPSGSYWIDLYEADPSSAFLAYCDMETEGGGWTLVWAYTFTLYNSFDSKANAVTPTPKNYVNGYGQISETAPKNETDFNALDFLKWKQIGSEVFMKSNINNWIACLPDAGSFVSLTQGSMKCRMVKQIAFPCSHPPHTFSYANNGCNMRKSDLYYYYDTNPGENWPTHDPCGTNKANQLKDVPNPHGNIYVR